MSIAKRSKKLPSLPLPRPSKISAGISAGISAAAGSIAGNDLEHLDQHIAALYPHKDVLEIWVRRSSRIDSPDDEDENVVPGHLSPLKPENRKLTIPGRGSLTITPQIVLDRLDPGFFTKEFDPVSYYLENSFPTDLANCHETFQHQITEKDLEKDMIMRQLATEVEENYEELIAGMKQVNQVDLDVATAGIEVANCRLRLTSASKAMTEQLVKIINLHDKREKMLGVQKVVKQISVLKSQYDGMLEAISTSDFHAAVKCALYVRNVASDSAFAQYSAVESFRDLVYKNLPNIRRRIDKALLRLCSRRFDGKEYAGIIRAYSVLEEFEPFRLQGGTYDEDNPVLNDNSGCLDGLSNRIQRFLLADLDNCCRAAIIEQIIQDGHNEPLMAQGDFPVQALYSKMRPSQLVPCVVRTCELLAEVIHTHYLITQWHRTPLDDRNFEMEYLHRCGVDYKDPFDFDEDDHSDEDEDLVERPRVLSAEDHTASPPLQESPSERGLRLTKAKLSLAYPLLANSRASLWENAQRGLTNLFNAVQATSSIPIEEFLVMAWTCDSFEVLGSEFCRSVSKTLESCVRTKSVQHFQNLHAESMTVITQMLEREPWLPVPVRVDELGGFNGIIRMNERHQAPSDMQRASKLCVLGLRNKDLFQEGSILPSFVTSGNPFSIPLDDATTNTQVDLSAMLASVIGSGFGDEDSASKSEETKIQTVVTQTALNGVARYTGRYSSMMQLMRPAAPTIFGGICQLYDLYLLGIFEQFLSPEMRRKTLDMSALPLNEAPAPRDSLNFTSIRKFIKRVMADMATLMSVHEGSNGDHKSREGFTRSITGTEDDMQSLLERVVASESGVFITALLKEARPRLKRRLQGADHAHVDAYASETSHAANQLSTLVYREAAGLLIERDSVVHSIELTNWDLKDLRTEPHGFVLDVCERCAKVWTAMHDPDSHLNQIPGLAKEQVWLECCQAAFDSVLEGFSRARRVSTQGRASMTMDLQSLNMGLNGIHRCSPPRGKDYVNGFVRAGYFSDDELLTWITNNFEEYAYRHVSALLYTSMSSVLKKNKLKQSLATVEEMYTDHRRRFKD